ncbi:MAG: hypothetical protein AAF182_01105 [Pseudomonadota bacterium]
MRIYIQQKDIKSFKQDFTGASFADIDGESPTAIAELSMMNGQHRAILADGTQKYFYISELWAANISGKVSKAQSSVIDVYKIQKFEKAPLP